MKTVSVIIPVYGVEKYLSRCVDSVLAQTYSALQIILVDDGSPDRCSTICDEYAQKDARVQVVHKQNGGISSARNTGLSIASGEYVCFFDSDDYVEPDMIEKLVFAIEENNEDVCVCGYFVDFYDEQGNQLSTKTIAPTFSYIQAGFPLKDFEEILGWCGYVWNKLYRLSTLKDGDFYFEEGISLGEDLLFNRQVFCSGAKVRFLTYSGYHYIQRKRETLGVKHYTNYFELKEKALEAKCAILREWGVEEKRIAQFYNDNYIDIIWGTIRNIKRSYLSKQEKSEKVTTLIKGKQTRQRLRQTKPSIRERKLKKSMILLLWSTLLLKIVR